ncbi:MAG: circularly permuted type 2 ATP-grasp protein [Acidimicrobiia bacterium]
MTPSSLIASYQPLAGVRDEAVDAEGRIREHWAPVSHVLDELGISELVHRNRQARQLLANDGVTYNIYEGRNRVGSSWKLDALPVLVASEEWARIELGVIQRAELLNLILSDLYGPRDLIRRNLIPPELVYDHRGFVRACDQIRIPGEQQLFSYAVDVARTGDGNHTVLSDFTQAPSGAGYALENRVVVSRVFPSLYRNAQVHRLAPFFRALRSSLQALVPSAVDDPRIVVLTPGPLAETAFEHAYLASYLGYPLVQGDDLVVRDGCLWMRTLGRLERVHVVLRRVDAWFCDPLELRPDSQLGIAGLVEASRLGNVSVVNTFGAGVLENPGLIPFLPMLCERLLGQSLRLPSVPTWWCGDRLGLSHVRENLDHLVLKRISRRRGRNSLFGWDLTRAERDEVLRRIEARPQEWVGQEPMDLGCAPTLTPSGLEPRRTTLRAFAVSRKDSYSVMPGGLTRVAATTESTRVANHAGSLSKDTWVIASEPEKLTGFWLDTGPTVTAVAPAASMSSRAAENLFWVGRYVERAEATARLLRVVNDRRTEFHHGVNPAGTDCVRLLLEALTHVTTTYPGFVGTGADKLLSSPGAELKAVVTDSSRPGTLAHALSHLVTAVQAVRDQLSIDTWLVVGDLEREIDALRGPVADPPAAVQAALSRVMAAMLSLAGLAAESMVRDPGWYFMDTGRRIERAIQLTALLRATLITEHETATESLMLESVLTAAESIITYRRRYRSHAQVETLLDLLIADAGNPRSLAYQCDRVAEDVTKLPTERTARLTESERIAIELSTLVRLSDTAALAAVDSDGRRGQLDAFCLQVLELLIKLANAVDGAHFTHRPPQRSMVGWPAPDPATIDDVVGSNVDNDDSRGDVSDGYGSIGDAGLDS